jgi:hypothetical protein
VQPQRCKDSEQGERISNAVPVILAKAHERVRAVVSVHMYCAIPCHSKSFRQSTRLQRFPGIKNLPTVTSSLSSGLNSLGSSQVVDKVTLGLEVLNVSTVLQDLLVGLEGFVLGSVERSESPLLGNDDSLLTGDWRGKCQTRE